MCKLNSINFYVLTIGMLSTIFLCCCAKNTLEDTLYFEPSFYHTETEYDKNKTPGYSKVLLNIDYKIDEKNSSPGFITNNGFTLIEPKGKMIHKPFSRNQILQLSLESGTYEITQIYFGIGLLGLLGMKAYSIDTDLVFYIDKPGLYYIGSIYLTGEWDFNGDIKNQQISIRNEIESLQGYPGIKKIIVWQ